MGRTCGHVTLPKYGTHPAASRLLRRHFPWPRWASGSTRGWAAQPAPSSPTRWPTAFFGDADAAREDALARSRIATDEYSRRQIEIGHRVESHPGRTGRSRTCRPTGRPGRHPEPDTGFPQPWRRRRWWNRGTSSGRPCSSASRSPSGRGTNPDGASRRGHHARACPDR